MGLGVVLPRNVMEDGLVSRIFNKMTKVQDLSGIGQPSLTFAVHQVFQKQWESAVSGFFNTIYVGIKLG